MHESTFICNKNRSEVAKNYKGKDIESSVPYKKIYVLKYYMANEV